MVVVVTRIIKKRLTIVLMSLEQQEKDRRLFQKTKAESEKDVSREESTKEKSKSSKKRKESKKSSRREKEKKMDKLANAVVKSIQKKFASKPERKLKEVRLYDGDLTLLMRQLGPFLEEFRSHPEQYNVCPNVVPGFLYNALPSHPPEDPQTLEAVWSDYTTLVWPGYTHWQHPSFVAYFPCGRSVPDMLAELLLSAICVPTEDWISCPSLVEVEVSMVNWIGRGFGLPEEMLFHGNTETSTGGGVICESASEGIFTAVNAARTRKINQMMRQQNGLSSKEHFLSAPTTQSRLEKHHDIAGRLVIFSSTEAHSSIEKGCRLAMVCLRQLRDDPKKDFAVTGEIFEKAILEDLEAGGIPCMLHVILGSTSSCCYDALAEIGPIAKKHGMWVHVDSAYAGSYWIEPAYRAETQKGIEWVDSININPHKVLLHSNGMSLFWTRDMATLRGTYGYHGSKKKRMGDDTSEMFMHDSRRHKGLKAYFVYRSLGTDGLRAFIRQTHEMAGYLRGQMVNHPNIRLFGELKASLFAFQYVEPGMTETDVAFHSECLNTLLNETNEIWITYSKVHDHGIIRVAVGYEKTNKQDMDNLWALIKRSVETYRDKRHEPGLLRFPPTSSPASPIPHILPPPLPSDKKQSYILLHHVFQVNKAIEKCSTTATSLLSENRVTGHLENTDRW